MKKRLVTAMALALAAAGSASAADLVLYGLVDYGLQYVNTKAAFGGAKSDSFSMVSGERNGNRWGLRSSEDLGNGVKVGFQLESGFDADTGAGKQSRLFGRQAVIYVDSADYGSLKFGRTGSSNSPNGSYLSTTVIASPWGGGTIGGSHSAFYYNSWDDNAIEYKSPTFAGFNLVGHYSLNQNGDESSSSSDNTRDGSIGLMYKNGKFEARLVYEKTLWANSASKHDTQTYTAAARYVPGPWGVYGGFQYAQNVHQLGTDPLGLTEITLKKYQAYKKTLTGSTPDVSDGMKGFGLVTGVSYQWGATRLITSVSHTNYKVEQTSDKLGYLLGTVGFEHMFSKRTGIYGYYAFAKGVKCADDFKQHRAVIGTRHWF